MRLRGRIAVTAAPLICVGLAAMVLLLFPPGQYGFYPVCPVYRYLHVLCPGCGATRALAALLHGRVGEALRLNWLIVISQSRTAPVTSSSSVEAPSDLQLQWMQYFIYCSLLEFRV